MAKKKTPPRPFFTVRHEVNETLDALAHEILMSIQAMETAIDLGGMNDACKKLLRARVEAMKAVCMSRDDTNPEG